MPELAPLNSVPLVKEIISSVFSSLDRLIAERKAGKDPFKLDVNQMEGIIDQSLSRLQTGKYTDSWWQDITNSIGQKIVIPEYLNKPAVQEWLSDEQVAKYLKKKAMARIMGEGDVNLENASFLAERYSEETGEDKRFATIHVNGVVAILVAGFLASIPKNQKSVVAMIQQLGVNLQSDLANLEQEIVSQPYLLASKQTLTQHAEDKLSRILSLRSFSPSSCVNNLRELWNESEKGSLVLIDSAVKAKILYWTARLCATDVETLDFAKQLRSKLQQFDGDFNLFIVDALIESTDGRQDEALRILRDKNDSDSRSIFLSLLLESKTEQEALTWYDRENQNNGIEFFTPVGWCNWAVIKANCGGWDEVLKILPEMESQWEQTPMLAVIEGSVNAAKLLPEEFRSLVLSGAPLYSGITRRVDNAAPTHHQRATDCFNFVVSYFEDNLTQTWLNALKDWQIWLSLMNPNSLQAENSRTEITERMKIGEQAVRLIPFAHTFEFDFNDEPLTKLLKYRKEFGGLNEEEIRAEFFLNVKNLDGASLLNYLEQNKSRLQKNIPEEFLVRLHVDSMLSTNEDPTKVRNFIRDSAIGHELKDTLMILIDADQGKDVGEQLKLQFEQTRSLFDLKNCVLYSKNTGDYENLKSFALKQFKLLPNVENALEYVRCLASESKFEYESIIKFLEENSEITRQSNNLRLIKVQALIFAGRLEEAKEVNDILISQAVHPDSIRLDLELAIASSDWERMGGILDRAWCGRDSFQPEHLINFAQLSGFIVQTIDRALQFANAAVEKAPNDPRVLSAAYFLYFQLARENEVDEQWLHNAVEFSSSEKGPIWLTNIEEVVNDWIPRRKSHLQEIEQKWLEGEIPLIALANVYKLSLTKLLLHIPMRNANEPDTRRKLVLTTIACNRELVEMQEKWTIGLDITTVLILSYLGLLGKVINLFHHVKIAPELMELLIHDFIDVKFHQPSLIESARNFLQLFDREVINSVENSVETEQPIANETGQNLATLIHAAKKSGGKVVCTFPIYKPGSLNQDQANINEFEDLIIPIMNFCKLLNKFGKIDESDYKHAHAFLFDQGQTLQETVSESNFDCPIYLDELAVKYLQDAHILQPVANELDVYVHQELVQEFRDLSHEEDIGNELRRHIEEIRQTLKVALSDGDVSLMPRSSKFYSSKRIQSIEFDSIKTLLRDNVDCDAVCFDDRFFNHHSGYTRSDGVTIPITCILDILQFLHSNNHINFAEYINFRHKLRMSGFSFVQPELNELIYLLKQTCVEDESVVESVELRVYRQYAAHLDAMNLTNLDEVKNITEIPRIVGRHAIVELWANPEIPPSNVKALSNWVWSYVVKSTGANYTKFVDTENVSFMTKTMSFHLGSLLLPMLIESEDRYDSFTSWIEQNILSQLLPANSELIEMALRFNCDVIQSSDSHEQTAYSRLFLDQLPHTALGMMIRLNEGFAERHEYKFQRILNIAKKIKVVHTELYKATRQFFLTGKEQSVQDFDGNSFLVGLDESTGNIVVNRIVDGENKIISYIPPLRLLSPDSNVRLAEINKISDYLGPTSAKIDQFVQILKNREPNDQELFTVFDELAMGISPLQAKLVQKFRDGQSMNVDDFVPSNISYYEKFCGPQPTTTDLKFYRHNVIIPYRKTLISRDLRKGLDICCLGSFTDDLYPGKWIDDFDNDTVWTAISTLGDNHNPFWLLGVLDVALYRLDDSRFRNYAVDIIGRLTDDDSSNSVKIETFEYLANIAEFVLNKINTIENGARCSIYWKRMAAWMQTGFIFRTLTDFSNTETLKEFQNWIKDFKSTAGTYSTLIDCRVEPMIFANRVSSHSLQINVRSRLQQLLLCHVKMDHGGQNYADLKEILTPLVQETEFLEGVPSIFEGHCSPRDTLTEKQSSEIFGEDYSALDIDKFDKSLRTLLNLSQIYKFGTHEQNIFKNLIENFSATVENHSIEDNLMYLDFVSVIVAANRSAEVAEDISELLVLMSPKIEKQQIGWFLVIIFQAAAVFEDRNRWFKWLERTLSDVVTQLPFSAEQNGILSTILQHLLELDLILPTSSWFHQRAKSIASAGARI